MERNSLDPPNDLRDFTPVHTLRRTECVDTIGWPHDQTLPTAPPDLDYNLNETIPTVEEVVWGVESKHDAQANDSLVIFGL